MEGCKEGEVGGEGDGQDFFLNRSVKENTKKNLEKVEEKVLVYKNVDLQKVHLNSFYSSKILLERYQVVLVNSILSFPPFTIGTTRHLN